MTAALVLAGYGLLAGTVGAAALARAGWPARSPWLGLVAWQALGLSVLSAVVLAGVTLAAPALPFDARLGTLLDACLSLIREHYAGPGGGVPAWFGAVVVAVVAVRLVVGAAGELRAVRRRVRLRRDLLLVARPDRALHALVLQHGRPAVYCLPGRRPLVVCTSAAVSMLTGPELRAVVAHERAHLRRRHDLVLRAAGLLRSAFPVVPVFSTGYGELQRLVEMDADDRAVLRCDRRALASAVVRLACGRVPAAALGAASSAAVARVRRLGRPAEPVAVAGAVAVALVAAVAVMLPLLMAAGPALAAAWHDYCPPGFPLR